MRFEVAHGAAEERGPRQLADAILERAWRDQRGGMRSAPSSLIVSPLSIAFSTS